MSRVTEQMKKINSKKGTFLLQLTAMVDMFTIMLVFLLKSFTTSAIAITPADGMNLPISSIQNPPIEALKLMVSRNGIFIEDAKVLDLEDGQIPDFAMMKGNSAMIQPLFEALEKEAKKSEEIAAKNQSVEFTGQILMQADGRLSYDVLKRVMYTVSMAGYSDLKLATISSE
jgi:biopolymer transport protein ExbD